MYFIDGDNIDRVWSKVVKALADGDGALARTSVVSTAKVAASSNGREGCVRAFSFSAIPSFPNGIAETLGRVSHRTHLICVYVNDSWNLKSVEKAFKALRDECGLLSQKYKVRPPLVPNRGAEVGY